MSSVWQVKDWHVPYVLECMRSGREGGGSEQGLSCVQGCCVIHSPHSHQGWSLLLETIIGACITVHIMLHSLGASWWSDKINKFVDYQNLDMQPAKFEDFITK